ncbi:hypothetical protein TNCV_834051 [Trichonephila clavipes]|nr:hypothetical protein TNCV_834051 [Trichonephila clavipes]
MKEAEMRTNMFLTLDGNTERRAGVTEIPITNSREDGHVTRKALMDRAATSSALSQELRSLDVMNIPLGCNVVPLINTRSDHVLYAMVPHIITPAVVVVCHCTTKAGLMLSQRLRTRTQLSSLQRLNTDSSLKTT